ncbi:reverse transcriptase domain-containing protein [Tanacetum coccineum]
MKLFKHLRLEIGLKDALIEMPKFNKWLSTLLRNKEKLEEIAITTVNVKCSAIILNKVLEKLEDPGKFLIPCALQELDRTNALADSGASINLLPYSIYKQLGLGALKPTRITLELANRSVTHPMGIAEDVVVRVDGFTFLADFVVVNFEPDPRVPIILGRPFLRTAKALIDLYEEKLTLRVGNDELVFYAEKSLKSKNKQFAHAIYVIYFSKDEPFSGSTTNHSDALPPSSSLNTLTEVLGVSQIVISLSGNSTPYYDPNRFYFFSDWYDPRVFVPTKFYGRGLREPGSASKALGVMTIIKNDEMELIPNDWCIGVRICIDYKKVNEATRKDNFPLPLWFTNARMTSPAKKPILCFLDCFSVIFRFLRLGRTRKDNILLTHTETFDFGAMPFGLCNCTGTFHLMYVADLPME